MQGLDTLNPILTINNKLKLVSEFISLLCSFSSLKLYLYAQNEKIDKLLILIQVGEYDETIGTCYIFTEQGKPLLDQNKHESASI